MALKTKNEVVQEIAYETYGGLPPNDRAISDNFILRKLNNRIVEAAVKSAFGTFNLDGIVEADGIFRLTYTGLTLTLDPIDGVYYFVIPAQPAGLPSQRAYIIYPNAMRGGRQSNIFKLISPEQANRVRSLPPIKKVFCFPENGNMKMIDSFQIAKTYATSGVNLSVVTSGGNNLSDFLNLPDDMIAGIKMLIVPELRQMLGIHDSDPLPPQDTPKPRQGE